MVNSNPENVPATTNSEPATLCTTDVKLIFPFARLSLCRTFAPRARPVRPAPVELPQGRNAARVDGCSGAMQVLAFFIATKALRHKKARWID